MQVEKSKIITLDSVSEISKKIHDFCKPDFRSTLIVFDLDLTLIRPVNNLASHGSMELHKDYINKSMQEFSKEQCDELFNIAICADEQAYMEDRTPWLVNDFLDKGASVIALTAALSGKVQEFERFEEVRKFTLDKLNLRFSDISKEKSFYLDELDPFRGNYPIYYNGIIFGNGVRCKNTKGDILKSFLNRKIFTPEKIVFVDDVEKNVLDVANMIEEFGIPFLSIRYDRHEKIPYEPVHFKEFKNFWDPFVEKVRKNI